MKETTEACELTNNIVDDLFRKLNSEVLTKEEEKELFQRIWQGDINARNELIEKNIKLVVIIAKDYIGKGLEYIDIIQEGTIGLMKAIEKYDIEKETKFSTYASFWINQNISRALENQGRCIRIPVPVNERMKRMQKAYYNLEKELNREPTTKEISAHSNLKEEEVIYLSKLQEFPISLNQVIKDNEKESTLEDSINSEEIDIEITVMNNILKKEIQELIEKCQLTAKEKIVINMRYGLINDRIYTLKEIGTLLNLSTEGIRRIEKRSLNKIRMSKYIKSFANYTSNPKQSINNIDEYRKTYYKEKETRKKR